VAAKREDEDIFGPLDGCMRTVLWVGIIGLLCALGAFVASRA
jgi:hypothetical protein